MSGYHVEWNHKAPKIGGNGSAPIDAAENFEVAKTKELSPSQSNEITFEETLTIETPTAAIIETSVETKPESTEKANQTIVEKPSTVAKTNRESITPNVLKSTFETQSYSKQSNSATDIVVLVILAIFLPPLAVYLHEGSWNNVCWLNLILTLLFWLGSIHALLVIFDVI